MINKKICLVTSSGGHLTQLVNLRKWWEQYTHFWVTFNKVDANSILYREKIYYAYHPTNRNILNLIRNTYLALKIIRREKPDIIISTGAGVAIPFYYIGKLSGAKLIFLEVFDRIDSPTITGKVVYPIVDKFLVQWEEQRQFYPKGEFWGKAL